MMSDDYQACFTYFGLVDLVFTFKRDFYYLPSTCIILQHQCKLAIKEQEKKNHKGIMKKICIHTIIMYGLVVKYKEPDDLEITIHLLYERQTAVYMNDTQTYVSQLNTLTEWMGEGRAKMS